jgi:hypothetical protein
MTKKIRDKRLDDSEDFILSPRHNNSLKALIEEHPDGVSDVTICRVLDLSKEELTNTYDSAIRKLRSIILNREGRSDK